MSSTRNPGRTAGFLYLALSLLAPFRMMYIPATLFVHGNPAANIVNHETLFRAGIVCDLACVNPEGHQHQPRAR